MFEYFALTDGTAANTLVITDNVSYALVGYQMAVNPLEDAVLPEAGPYATETDVLTFHALGNTASEAYAAAAAVNALLDQASRWHDEEPVGAIEIRCVPQGSVTSSVGSPMRAVLDGRASGGPPNMQLPATWSAAYGKYILQNCTATFLRRAPWLSSSETVAPAGTVTASAAADFAWVATATLVPAPVSIVIDGFPNGGPGLDGFLIIGPSARLAFFEAEALATGPFTSVADAANVASAGNVLRYTPVGTAFANTNAVNNWYVATGVLHTVYAMARCNTAAAVYTVRLQDSNGNALTPDVTIDSAVLGLGNPTPICLGTFANPGGLSTAISGGGARLSVAASTIAGGPTLDFDCFVVVCLDDELARVIELTASPSNFSSPNSDQVTFDPRALTKPKPDVVAPYAFPFGGEYSYRGNAYLQAKNALRAFLLAPGGAGPFFTAYWRYTNGAGAALAFTWSASRPVAYLIPQ